MNGNRGGTSRQATLTDLAVMVALLGCFGCAPGRGADDQPDGPPSATVEMPRELWIDVTADVLGETAEWTNKVELADLDGDGRIDLLFANGGGRTRL